MSRPKTLRRVSDSDPGLRRQRRGDGFAYFDVRGNEIADPDTLARIRSLAIPPAYTDVWICSHANGHIQATGRDARGRKQYRYHPEFRCLRDATKFGRLAAFGRALPAIRARVSRDIRLPGLPRSKVLATIVRLLELTLIRIGNGSYARANKSYGLTTLRNRHVDIRGSTVSFAFRGKSGIRHRVSVRDRALAGIVQRIRDLPGYELFQYLDPQRQVRDVSSNDVNAYLRDCVGEYFSAKDFRTWAGTLLCFNALRTIGPPGSLSQAKKVINRAVGEVAGRLGNTPAVCRKSYIHPAVIAAYQDGSLFDSDSLGGAPAQDAAIQGLGEDEARLLSFLEETCL